MAPVIVPGTGAASAGRESLGGRRPGAGVGGRTVLPVRSGNGGPAAARTGPAAAGAAHVTGTPARTVGRPVHRSTRTAFRLRHRSTRTAAPDSWSASRRMSASTMIRASSRDFTSGFQPSSSSALEASPINASTSLGRSYFGS